MTSFHVGGIYKFPNFLGDAKLVVVSCFEWRVTVNIVGYEHERVEVHPRFVSERAVHIGEMPAEELKPYLQSLQEKST